MGSSIIYENPLINAPFYYPPSGPVLRIISGKDTTSSGSFIPDGYGHEI
jgi:hypothetical protein